MGQREVVVKIGDVVEGRYRILKTLGQGGMGSVFLAEHALIKRKVAIKILHPDLATDADVIERFMNEARAAGTLGHPNIVESTDMGFTSNHVPYIVFEYLEGTLLTDEIYRVGGLPVRRAMRIADQITSALAAAHSAGIVHRDLKSDNIFLTDKDDALDHVKVLDFGISRFLEVEDRQRTLVMGTPEFAAAVLERGRSAPAVSSVVGAHRPEVLKCFAAGKKKDHAMKGTLAVQLAVDTAGKVKHIQVQSTLDNPLVAACVAKSANAWRFPSRRGGEVAMVNYPFTIN